MPEKAVLRVMCAAIFAIAAYTAWQIGHEEDPACRKASMDLQRSAGLMDAAAKAKAQAAYEAACLPANR